MQRLLFSMACLFLFACADPCDERSVDDCTSDSECSLVRAKEVHQDAMCVGPSSPVACAKKGMLCGSAMSYATDEDSALWEFTNTCIPPSWSSAERPEGLELWPECGSDSGE
jgi:hypothetical protein